MVDADANEEKRKLGCGGNRIDFYRDKSPVIKRKHTAHQFANTCCLPGGRNDALAEQYLTPRFWPPVSALPGLYKAAQVAFEIAFPCMRAAARETY